VHRRSLVAVAAASLLLTLVVGVAGTGVGGATAPTFTVTPAPNGLGTDSGEPSVGVDVKTGAVMFQAGLQTLRITGAPTGTSTWTDVGSPLTSTVTLDPILHTNRATGRTFVSQLLGGCSLMAYSDDDGGAWTQHPFGCGAGTAADHQTVGSGPYPASLAALAAVSPIHQAVYYCAQAVAAASCARSDDGGLSFGAASPMYTAAQCGGLHGHAKVAPDGTVYVPNADCGGQQGVAFSNDGGTTWQVSTVPGSKTQDESDPSVAIGTDGSVWLGYQQDASSGGTSSTTPYVVRGTRNGTTITWGTPVAVNPQVRNLQFPAAVAGDAGRAAFAYLGTTTAGDDQAATFPGVWHLFVSTTYDGGATWTTTDATGADPVQRGCIWLGGGSNDCRNLLDFIDATLDGTGHVVVAIADGCTAACVTDPSSTAKSALATLAYQTGGDPLTGAIASPLSPLKHR
jgi:hypothetical protein